MNGHPLDRVSTRLIRHAARSTPGTLAQRLEEEWLADMAARGAPAARLRLALGCWWAASIIAREHGVTALAAAAGSGGTTTAAARGPGLLSRRTTALVLIASLHLALVYFLTLGLAQRSIEVPPPSIQAGFEDELRQRDPPPPFKVQMRPEKFELPTPPEVPVVTSTDAGITGGVVIDRSGSTDPVAPPPKVDRVMGGPGRSFPAAADYYPDASRRLGETGAAAVQVCVDAHGHLTSNPTLTQSSGSTRLDAAALALARAGSGYYRATTEDGRAVSSCFPFRIRFRLSD